MEVVFLKFLDPTSGELFYTRAGSFESTADGFVVLEIKTDTSWSMWQVNP